MPARARYIKSVLRAAITLALGAVAYSLAEGVAHLTFGATPLSIGVIVLTAALVGGERHLVPNGLVLASWGAAVLAIGHGPFPGNRTAPGYLVGMALGLLIVAFIVNDHDRAAWTRTAALTAVAGGLVFYFAFDIAALDAWQLWAALLLGWAGLEALHPGHRQLVRRARGSS